MATQQRVLIVTTSHGRFGAADVPTGLWLEELATPYWILRDGGCAIDIASMAGGQVPVDPRSLEGERPASVQRFLADSKLAQCLAASRALADIAPANYTAIFLPGGHGTLWDFPADARLARAIAGAYDEGRVVAAVCHGPAGLIGAVRADGKALVGARRITAFTNAEEAAVGLTDYVPFLLESRLRELGGIFEHAAAFKPHAVRDGNLITGQNPQSSTAVAQLLLKALQEPRPDQAVVVRQAGINANPMF
jgi:putative intracellular protease/amidase